MTTDLLFWVGGMFGVSVVSAIFWDRMRWLRFLPIVYASLAGAILPIVIADKFGSVDKLVFFAAMVGGGAAINLGIWLQCR